MNTTDLKPIKVNSYELGYRGNAGKSLGYSLSAYRMDKRDDILSYWDPVTNATQSVNAGRTLHRGIRSRCQRRPVSGAGAGSQLRLCDPQLSPVAGEQRYRDYSGKGNGNRTAPDRQHPLQLHRPATRAGRLRQKVHFGGYCWIRRIYAEIQRPRSAQPARQSAAGSRMVAVRIAEYVTDRRYAESASLSSGNDDVRTGMPRTAYLGIEYKSK